MRLCALPLLGQSLRDSKLPLQLSLEMFLSMLQAAGVCMLSGCQHLDREPDIVVLLACLLACWPVMLCVDVFETGDTMAHQTVAIVWPEGSTGLLQQLSPTTAPIPLFEPPLVVSLLWLCQLKVYVHCAAA